MGRWFVKFFNEKGFDVAIHSRTLQRAAETAEELHVKYIESLDAVQDFDMVVVSTSLHSTAETIQKVSKKMRSNTILFDIASVKSNVIKSLEEAEKRGIRTISIHPMFGPGATSLKGKHVILIPVGDDTELVAEMFALFKGAETHILPSGEDHDSMVALMLSLPHFLNIVFGKTIKSVNIRDVTKLAGTTFTLQLLLAEAVLSEDPHLYYEIQSQNKAFTKVLETFLTAINELAVIIKEKKREDFEKSFQEVKASLSKDPNFTSAYNRFYKAYEAIS